MSERKAFLVRLDEALLEDLKRWAEAELRSLNGQIEYVLREAVVERRRGKKGALKSGAVKSGNDASKGD